jgi:hypothetical protein
VTSSSKVAPEFRMSAFVAVIGLRRYLRDHPHTPVEEAVLSLRRSDADFAASDFDGGLRLHALLPPTIDFDEPEVCIRSSLSILIELQRPWWLRFFPSGRQRLATALTQDEVQTFRSARLFDEAPSPEVVIWWDKIASQVRTGDNDRLVNLGRRGELLSLEYERQRLSTEGIENEPRWIALDDNSAGYDIKSYRKTAFGVSNMLIEVKSSMKTPPRIILTRGEWQAAEQFGAAYVFHVWSLLDERLLIKTVEEIRDHIPEDRGNGRWSDVEIQF